jgi:cytochrome c553
MSGLECMGSPVRLTVATTALLVSMAAWSADASIAAGKQIASSGTPAGVPACSSCHGAHGEGAGTFPRLAGTGQAYLLEQLDDFASGKRQSPIMQPFAQKLAPAERAAVASYFASLPPPLKAIDKEPATPGDAGAWLATRGRWRDQVPACAQCHGPGGSGVGPNLPPLAGLPADYVTAQLNAWRAGTRAPGPLGLMQGVAKKLTDADVAAVAAYYAGLAASAKAAPSGAKEQQR